MKSRDELRKSIAVIIALDRWDTSIISEEIAEKILDKLEIKE